MQATDRLGMIQSLGRLCNKSLRLLSLSISIVYFSPWLLLLLTAGVVPAFLGRESLCIFGIRQEFPSDADQASPRLFANSGRQQGSGKGVEAVRSRQISYRAIHQVIQWIYRENVELSGRRLREGWRAAHRAGNAWLLHGVCMGRLAYGQGRLSIGTLYFLAGAILQASNNIQQIFSTASSIADQALFLTDLLAFFEMRPTIRSKPNALPAPRPIVSGFEFRDVSFTYPGTERLVLDRCELHPASGRARRADWGERRR